MRIASETIFRQAVAAMQQAQTDLARGQEQLSSGERIQRAGEDPSAFSSAARMAAREAQLESFARSGERATQRLSLAETRIAETRDVLDRVREIAVQGNSPALSATDRQALDTELAQIRERQPRVRAQRLVIVRSPGRLAQVPQVIRVNAHHHPVPRGKSKKIRD